MSSNIQITEKNMQWEKFCIAVLSGNTDELPVLNINPESLDTFIEYLYKQGIEAILIDLLDAKKKIHLLPDIAVEKLIEIRRNAHIKEIYRGKNLLNLLDTLNSNDIRCLILKGTAFAYSLYHKPYQRSRVDTDILIKTDDKQKVDQLLLDSGFSKLMNNSGELISHQSTYCQIEDGIKHAYDIHWKISNSNAYANRFEFQQLYTQKSDLKNMGHFAFKLNNVDAFLHGTVHYFGHRVDERKRLIWIYDLHLLCKQFSDQNWETLLQSSKQKELDPLCLQTLTICQTIFATTIPNKIIEHLQQSEINLSEVESNRIYSSEWSRIDQFKSDWAVLSFQQRLQLIKEYLFPTAEFILEQQKSSNKLLIPYFYLKRIVIGGINVLTKK